MKNFTRLVALSLLTGSVSARAQFAVTPVLGHCAFLYHSVDFIDIPAATFGFQTGMLAEYKLSGRFGLQTGALYSIYFVGVYRRIDEVEIPVTLVTKFGASWWRNRLYLGVGPNVRLQPGGNASDNKAVSTGEYAPLRYLGLNVSIGYEFQNGMYTRGAVQPGQINVLGANNSGYYISQFSFCLGYRISFEKKDYSVVPATEK